MKKIYRLEVLIFTKIHHGIPFLLVFLACVWRLQIPLKKLNFEKIFVKTLVTFTIIYATDLIMQNITKIVCLR